jgi:hypothetical protein
MFEVPETFAAFLAWIGSIAFFNIAAAPLLERLWPALKIENSEVKSLISVLAAVGLALASKALIMWTPAGVVSGMEEWYQVAAGAVIGWLTMQASHYKIDQRESRLHPEGTQG